MPRCRPHLPYIGAGGCITTTMIGTLRITITRIGAIIITMAAGIDHFGIGPAGTGQAPEMAGAAGGGRLASA